jgi:hypothetical protein
MSTARKEFTSYSPLKTMGILEQEIPLDMSRISNLCSFEANITQDEYNEERLNSIKKEIQNKERKFSYLGGESTGDKNILDSLEKTDSKKLSSIKKLQTREKELEDNQDLKKLHYSDDSDEEEEFYENDFGENNRSKSEEHKSSQKIKDPIDVLLGENKCSKQDTDQGFKNGYFKDSKPDNLSKKKELLVKVIHMINTKNKLNASQGFNKLNINSIEAR